MTAETDRLETMPQGTTQEETTSQTAETAPEQTNENAFPKRTILIGSQRNPERHQPTPAIPVVGEKPHAETYPPDSGIIAPDEIKQPRPAKPAPKKQKIEDDPDDEHPDHLSHDGEKALKNVPVNPVKHISVPRVKYSKVDEDIESELNSMLGGSDSLDSLLTKSEAAMAASLEPETKVQAKVLAVHQENVFLDLGTKEQGVVSLKLFPPENEPKIGDTVEVTVVRFLNDEGLYDVSVPLAAADVKDWSQVQEGMIVEARITKTNTGGLECEVNNLRGFIPVSQIELFRVENTEQYVGQKLTCVVEEVNTERRNLVLSRRAMLNREREEKRVTLLTELEVGQTREGIVRKIIDAGAFVDLGGVDGFIPVGAMSWGRIRHPSDVLSEGSRVKVRISKIDEAGNRISLIYRDDASNPWANILERFQEKTIARGKVSKIMDFGAFVELMPGVEGLVHISELANKHVNNVKEILREGDWTDVLILSIDTENKKIALSVKQTLKEEPRQSAEPENSNEQEAAPTVQRPPIKMKNAHTGPLKGGTGQSSGGGAFGLKW